MLNRRQELLETLRKKSAAKQAKHAKANAEEKTKTASSIDPRCFRLFRPAATPASRCFVIGLSVATHTKPSPTRTATPLDRFVHHRLFEPWLVPEICGFLAPDKIRRWQVEPAQSTYVVADVAIDEAANRIFVAKFDRRGFHNATYRNSSISTYDFNGDPLQTFFMRDTRIVTMCVDARHDVFVHARGSGDTLEKRTLLIRRFHKRWSGYSPQVETLFQITEDTTQSPMYVHPNARLIYMAHGWSVKVWNFTGDELASLQGNNCILHAAPNILWTSALDGGGIFAFDAVSFQELAHFPPPLPIRLSNLMFDVDHSLFFASSNRVYTMAQSSGQTQKDECYYAIDFTDAKSRQTAIELLQCNDVAQMDALCGSPTLRELATHAPYARRIVVHSTLHFAFVFNRDDGAIYVLAPGWFDLE